MVRVGHWVGIIVVIVALIFLLIVFIRLLHITSYYLAALLGSRPTALRAKGCE